MNRTTVVLVPGAFTAPGIWRDCADLLTDRGVAVVTVTLPTVGIGSAPGTGFRSDVRAVRDVLDGLTAPVLVCGHSYGGAVATEAAAGPHPAVRRLLYLNAAIPDRGYSLVDLMVAAVAAATDAGRAASPETGVIERADGLAELDPGYARRVFFGDCTPERAAEGMALVVPGRPTGEQVLRGAAWRELPTTIVRGTLDPIPVAIAPDVHDTEPEQVELAAGHCPHWSMPDVVADLVADRAAIATR